MIRRLLLEKYLLITIKLFYKNCRLKINNYANYDKINDKIFLICTYFYTFSGRRCMFIYDAYKNLNLKE
jgi:hypothetical protein